MHTIRISLFGRYSCSSHGIDVSDAQVQKAQELLAYLALYRRSHHREALAELLWSDSTAAQAKKNLRHTLWRLQSTLNGQDEAGANHLILVDGDWILMNPVADFWLDVAAFEEVHDRLGSVRGNALNKAQAGQIEDAIGLYVGDLLDGWYDDWWMFDRERLRLVYLLLLDKLLGYCEANGLLRQGHRLWYENPASGFNAGNNPPASDATHVQERAAYRSHSSIQGIRAAALREELGVVPSQQTVLLYQQICADEPADPSFPDHTGNGAAVQHTAHGGRDMLDQLHEVVHSIETLRSQSLI